MKNSIFALITAVLIIACFFTGCEQKETDIYATPDEAYSMATDDEAQVTTAEGSTAAGTTVPGTQPATEKDQKTTKPSTDATQPATKPPVQKNIPKDTISGKNINPNLSGIIGMVNQEISDSAIRTIGLDYSKRTIKVGEKIQLTISYDPEDAVPKTCTVSASNKCVQASISNGTVTVVGKSEGTAEITVKSYNGATAHCMIYVTKSQQGGGGETPAAITDDTVLPHAKVCTKANADRWRAAVEEYCAGTGMKKNTSLSGGTVTVSTEDYTSNGSFNSYKNQIVNDAAAQVDTYTGKQYAEYEYSCMLVADGSEYTVVVTLYKTENE